MNKTIKKYLSTILIIMMIAGAIYYYQQSKKLKPEDLYRLQTITQGDVEQSVNANGTINPVSLINVGTQVSGLVSKLFVDYNDKVKAGQILLELDDALFTAQIAQSKGNLHNAQASLDLAKANEARMRNLFSQDFASKQDLDQAVQSLESAKAQLDTVKAQLSRDQTNLAYSIIRSPVSGIVVDRVIDVGQTVAASFQTPTLITIAQDLSKMQINTSFAEADIGNIKVGQKAKFTVDAFPNRNFEGVVKQLRLNPTTVSNVVTYNVVISVDNSDETLLPGMTAFVTIAIDHHDDVLLAPNSALRYKPTLSDTNAFPATEKHSHGDAKKHSDQNTPRGKLYVLRDNQPVEVKLTLGLTDGKLTEIKSDQLKVGDKVIVGESQPDSGGSASGASPMRMRSF